MKGGNEGVFAAGKKVMTEYLGKGNVEGDQKGSGISQEEQVLVVVCMRRSGY